MMGVDAFILYDYEPRIFIERFLNSPEFTTDILKAIARENKMRGSSGKKSEIAANIIGYIGEFSIDYIANTSMKHLINRPKDWISIKSGNIQIFPELDDPKELALYPGEQKWYGPMNRLDDIDEARWYIRPVHVNHLEKDDNGEDQKRIIRWHCFARVTDSVLSLHWKGFTYADNPNSTTKDGKMRTVQFPYWQHVPSLFNEIETLTQANVDYINLHHLVLHQLWDEYLGSPEYSWDHWRIRAESGGVTLNARAGSVLEIKGKGIKHLATTIRRAVQQDLEERQGLQMLDPDYTDEVILRTLIREYGARSYEFGLAQGGQSLFNAHNYFGNKKDVNSPDIFPHLQLTISQVNDLNQLNFLLDNLRL